jgi:hypothetical protein
MVRSSDRLVGRIWATDGPAVLSEVVPRFVEVKRWSPA